MLDIDTIHTCDFFHPASNFASSRRPHNKPEAEFADSFARVYQRRFPSVHAGITRRQTLFVRELPVHGNGIADLVVLNWGRPLPLHSGIAPDLSQANPTVRAFEVKLSNWRGGLMQAHRYRYFSHVSVLVVPRSKLKTVGPHLNLFQTLRVGLWGFDSASESITSLYTPRPKRQQIARYGARALATALQAASL